MKLNFSTFKKTLVNWYGNDPFSQSAAISYYTIFSFPALAFIYLSLASIFADRIDVQNQLTGYFREIVGSEDAGNIQSIIENTAPKYTNFWALAVGFGIILFAGLKLFLQLQSTLNKIWAVKPNKHAGILNLVKQRLVAFSVMLGAIFIMLSSLIISSLMAAFNEFIAQNISQEFLKLIFIINFSLSLCITSFLFAVLLKLLPDARVIWRYALCGGIFTAILFAFGQYLLNIYFKLAAPASAYGVTASIILLMLWVFYTCAILLMGAEFTKTLQEQNTKQIAKPTELGVKDVTA